MTRPTNALVTPLLTDLYQITMAYGYWKSRRHDVPAVFDLFFRHHPFNGEFTIFAGLEEVLRFLDSFHFKADDCAFLKRQLPDADPAFFDWLGQIDASALTVYGVLEGTVVFPRIPLLRVEGPLAVVQLLETALLTLVNYASLVATNAARFRLAAGADKLLMEFGLRRAQGPDGAVSASLYCYMGGFDATSNVAAARLFDIPVKGTMAHSFIQSFSAQDGVTHLPMADSRGQIGDFAAAVSHYHNLLGIEQGNAGEMAAFIAYAQAFPRQFLALVDTYDALYSGIPNFLCVALALKQFGYAPIGIRLDSGDLAHLSGEARRMFAECYQQTGIDMGHLSIVASNDINESVLHSLNSQGHAIDAFGIGTHLVTCQAQPALGCVYKLVEINGRPRIKLSQDADKVTIPGRKHAFRLIGQAGFPLLDLMLPVNEPAPQPGHRLLCRNPFAETQRVFVTPSRVQPLHHCMWQGGRVTPAVAPNAARQHVLAQLSLLRPDHLRPTNPTPYKVSVSPGLYEFLHRLWQEEAPVRQMA